jgi:hypothetical protein
MKKHLFKLIGIASAICFSMTVSAQTTGTLTFVFTEATHATSTTYNGNAQHVLAVWVQTNAGAFVKTKLRYAGGGTSDHLPTWATSASCTSGNCISTACNTVDGITGATASAWKTYTVTWDGKKGAAATGTLQADGVYKVAIQSTWNHGTAGTAISTYTFTKGAAVDQHTVANIANFTNVSVKWQPSTVTGIDENVSINPEIVVYPNPTNGILNVDYTKATNIKVINTLGAVIYDEKLDVLTQGTKAIDLSNFANGIYFINISNGNGFSNHKVILDK